MMRFALIPEFQVQEAGDGARAQAADQERGLQAGGRDAYFAKPFSPSALVRHLHAAPALVRLRNCSLLAEHPLDAVQHYRDVTAYVDLDETKTTFLKAASIHLRPPRQRLRLLGAAAGQEFDPATRRDLQEALGRALPNVLDSAVKFSPQGEPIRVGLASGQDADGRACPPRTVAAVTTIL